MRRLLPLALLLVACTKPQEAAIAPEDAPVTLATSDMTPSGMAKAADVPYYPGATAPDGMSSAPKTGPDGSTHYSLVLATNDPVGKVAGWYGKELSLPVVQAMGGSSLVGKSKEGNDLMVTVVGEAGRTLVRVKSIAYKK